MKVLVIGGVNYDLYAQLQNDMKLNDSNISSFFSVVGGVGQNIAVNLLKTDIDVGFISCVGDDLEGQWIKNQLNSLSLKYFLITKKEYKTGKYIAILNKENDMQLAISDTEIIQSLQLSDIDHLQNIINESEIICLDANLSEQFIIDFTNKYKDKFIIGEGVSCSKIMKFKSILNNISLLKANKKEIQSLLNTDENNLTTLAEKVIDHNVKSVVITDSKNGSVYKSKNKQIQIYNNQIENIVSASGAGDAFCAGIIYSLINKLDMLKTAFIFSKYALLSKNTVSEILTKDIILKEYKEIK
ncbi:PfkB family carbohydrate kinase [Mycoplasma sp. 06067-C1-B144P-99-0482-3]|uniref:PfkB family carbohydrate kinase n=1 Tax=Mycoplasma sp. 06067-C1-B144P-99-0482-3 TaxID=3117438 RepID=UPI003DA361A2